MTTAVNLYANAVVVTGDKKTIQPLNEIDVHICTAVRKTACDKKQECDKCAPHYSGIGGQAEYLGLTRLTFDKLSYKQVMQRTHSKLKKSWLQCRKVKLTVKEL